MDMYIKIPVIDNFAIYREELADYSNEKHDGVSIKNLFMIIKTKGIVLRKQNTNWVAAAFYKMNLCVCNKVLYLFSDVSLKKFDKYTKDKIQRKVKVEYKNI